MPFPVGRKPGTVLAKNAYIDLRWSSFLICFWTRCNHGMPFGEYWNLGCIFVLQTSLKGEPAWTLGRLFFGLVGANEFFRCGRLLTGFRLSSFFPHLFDHFCSYQAVQTWPWW